jgi:hypothetical protein
MVVRKKLEDEIWEAELNNTWKAAIANSNTKSHRSHIFFSISLDYKFRKYFKSNFSESISIRLFCISLR